MAEPPTVFSVALGSTWYKPHPLVQRCTEQLGWKHVQIPEKLNKARRQQHAELVEERRQQQKIQEEEQKAGLASRQLLPFDAEVVYAPVEHIPVKFDIGWVGVAGSTLVKRLKRNQKISHIPKIEKISQKRLLARNLNRMRKYFPEEYNFYPETWVLPDDYNRFKWEFEPDPNSEQSDKKAMFICKPNSSCEGRGIFITSDLADVDPRGSMVAQRYIPSPLLVEGRKFDLRVYVLITSIEPLRVYIYREGLARFCTQDYVNPHEDKDSLFAHLTNYSINKGNADFVKNVDAEDMQHGSKWSLTALMKHIELQGADVAQIQSRIETMMIRVCLSIQPALTHEYKVAFPGDKDGGQCFQMLGIDVMLDSKYKPWFIEVNRNPSTVCDTPLDKQIKEGLIRDTLRMVDPTAYIHIEPVPPGATFGTPEFSEWKQRRNEEKKNLLFKRETHEIKLCNDTLWKCIYPLVPQKELIQVEKVASKARYEVTDDMLRQVQDVVGSSAEVLQKQLDYLRLLEGSRRPPKGKRTRRK